MAPDYTEVLDWQQRQAEAGPDRLGRIVADSARTREIQRQAAERMARLLQGDEWQTFWTLVEGLIDDAEAALALQREIIEGGPNQAHPEGLVGDALVIAVGAVRAARVQIEAYRRVLALPREVIAAVPAAESFTAEPSRG